MAFENEIFLSSKNFFFSCIMISKMLKNEFQDNDEKSCNWFKNKATKKIDFWKHSLSRKKFIVLKIQNVTRLLFRTTNEIQYNVHIDHALAWELTTSDMCDEIFIFHFLLNFQTFSVLNKFLIPKKAWMSQHLRLGNSRSAYSR